MLCLARGSTARRPALPAVACLCLALTAGCGGSSSAGVGGSPSGSSSAASVTGAPSFGTSSTPRPTGLGIAYPTPTVSLAKPSGCGTTGGAAPGGGAPPTGGPAASAPPAQAAAATPTYANLRYAPTSSAQVLDLFVPTTGAKPFPLIIKIHGGAFRAGDKSMEETASDIAAYTAAGYAVASLNYRLSCEALFPAAVQDVKAATRFLRANAARYSLDSKRFAAWGESAGANLAAMVGATGTQLSFLDDPALGHPGISSAVQAVVGWYGPYDFATMDAQFTADKPAACRATQRHNAADSPESLYLGAAVPTVVELAASAGPAFYLKTGKGIPPFMLAAGGADCLVPHQQSSAFDTQLRAAGAASSFTLLAGAGHADPKFAATLTKPALVFLDRALKR